MPATPPIEQKIEQALAKVRDQATFIKDLLIDALEWPIEDRVESVD